MSSGIVKTNETSKYCEDWLPVKNIQNGMIQLENGEFVCGVKVEPKNIFILDQLSQNNVIAQLRNFYNTIDFEFWLIVSDRVVDISIYQSQLQLLYNNIQKPKLRKLINQDINKGNSFMANNVVDTEYYMLFREKNPELINKKLRTLINGFATCGLNASQATNEDLRTLIENFLNGGTRTQFGTVMKYEH